MTAIDIYGKFGSELCHKRRTVIVMALGNVDINAAFAADDASDNASKKWMLYTADNGDKYMVFGTESILSLLGFTDLTDANRDTALALPDYFRMRKVNFSDATGKVKGSYEVGSATEDIYANGGTIKVARRGKVDGVVCYATGTVGESRRLIYTGDTGQQSGDAS